MEPNLFEMVREIKKQQQGIEDDIILLKNNIQKIRIEFWEGYIPLLILIGTYTIMYYNTYSDEGVKHIIVPLDKGTNTNEFRR
tara:strand:+ start:106 stop:354 length:249 start_codon:yes stop_codon:yes gene_type:complete